MAGLLRCGVFLLVLCVQATHAQELATIRRLLANTQVKQALAALQRDEPQTLEEQVRLSEIEAPPFGEVQRGRYVQGRFQELGLQNVRTDTVGNVIGELPGKAAKPSVVLSAHLDTVFPKNTNVKVRREEGKLIGPGISDDARGLAVLLAVIKAMQQARLTPAGTIIFVATVGEEGLGDLRGVKHLFHESLKGRIDRFLSIDGTALGITNTAVGSYRYKVQYKGPGGHSFGAFGNANPIHALGRAISKISELQVPTEPKTTFNVGRIGGGTSVNAIAFEAWMEVDLRSSSPTALKEVDRKFNEAVRSAEKEENARWQGKGRILMTAELIGLRPAGQTSDAAPITKMAMAATEELGFFTALQEGSTDANVPMSLGIPALTLGGGGASGGTHSLDEWFLPKNSWQGSQRALLLTLALAQ